MIGSKLAMRVLQSGLYHQLDTDQKDECDELIQDYVSGLKNTTKEYWAVTLNPYKKTQHIKYEAWRRGFMGEQCWIVSSDKLDSIYNDGYKVAKAIEVKPRRWCYDCQNHVKKPCSVYCDLKGE